MGERLSGLRDGDVGSGRMCEGTANPGRRRAGLEGERDKAGAGGIGNLRFQDLKGGAEGEIMKDEL